jgi:DNA-binding SARP family transcriptional activator/tetratricopeptide (TPR) repeat protein
MRVRLLGPVELTNGDGAPVAIAAGKRRAVLAVLALELNQVVPIDRLLDLIWDGDPPPRARTAVQGHVSALRRLLSDGGSGLELATREPGYALLGTADDVDLYLFRSLAEQASGAVDDRAAAGLLGRALALWRGTPLSDLPSATLRDEVAARLGQARLAALEGWAERKVRLTEGRDTVPELEEAVRAEPFREPLVRLLLLALHQADRRPAALDLYHRTRKLLDTELGVDPGTPLRAAYETVLRAGPPTPPPPPQPAPLPVTRRPAPAQLPREAAGFVGRATELEALGAAQGLVLVVGPAGVGKTALTLRWAYRSVAAFPDGQLFADLRGFSAGSPVSAASVLSGFLRALGAADGSIPADLDERVALYRSLLAGRRVLVMLDNVRTVGDVLPLLPSGPGCSTVVTSRNLLGGLVAREGAAVVRVEALPPEESRALLARTVGPERIAAEAAASAELVRLCEGLPLALRVAGARLAMRAGWTVSELVADLSDEQARLSVLTTDDADSGVEAALRLSYRVLPEPAAGLFRLLGLHPGADVDAWTAAALSGQSLADARRSLTDLVSAHLLQETSTGRFARHDLVRLYTVRLAEQDLSAQERDRALDRLLDYYLDVTATAAEPLIAQKHLLHRPPVPPAAGIPPLAGGADASAAWFRTEVAAAQALVTSSADGPRADRAWRVACNTMPLYYGSEPAEDWVAAGLAGLRAADSSGNPVGRCQIHTDVGMALGEIGRFAEAKSHLERAVELAEQSGSQEMRYLALCRLAIGQMESGDLGKAPDTLKAALDVARAAADLPAQAQTLNNLGHVYNQLGRHREALDFAEQARRLAGDTPSTYTQLALLATTAESLQALGRATEAIEHAREAVRLSRAYGNSAYEALALRLIGQFQRELGQEAESAQSLRQSLSIYAQLGDRTEAAAVAALLGVEERDGGQAASPGADTSG